MAESGLETPKVYSDWVVGIGSSAGGLEAVGQFLSNLPSQFGGTVIVAQHLAPHSKSMMVELLSRNSTLPVKKAEDNMILEGGTVYVVPPNYDLDLVEKRMVLKAADDAIRPKPSVDEFFESLAKAYGAKSVGIILSGTGTDGSRGIEAIKGAGGITLAQDDQSAKYDGMPRSAIGTGKVDSILPPEVLAKNLLTTIFDHQRRNQEKKLAGSDISPIFELIRERLGQDFRSYKPSTIIRRINKRMAMLNFSGYQDYIEHLRSTPGEVGELAKELLISVTSFFRDPEVFTEIRERLVRMVQKNTDGNEIRIWIAGCATGEEAYTYAMLLLDIQDHFKRTFPIKIFATDLDHDAIQEGRAGVYPAKDVQKLPGHYLERFLLPKGQDFYELTKRVRDCVVFARQDLIQNPPFVKLDLISCRNVLIYFESDLQKRVLEIFHYALAPSGILVLGKSESILSTPQLFECLDRKNKIFEKLNIPSAHLPSSRLTKISPLDMPALIPRTAVNNFDSVAMVGYRKLISSYNIAAVIVDSEGTLIQVYGDVSPYIQFQNQADLSISNLLPRGVGLEIPVLIKRALSDRKTFRSRTHKIKKGSSTTAFQIVVRPLSEGDEEPKTAQSLVILNFEPKKLRDTVAADIETVGHIEIPRRFQELEQELYITKEHLQTVIEELGVSNEELQSLNEELSSTNEELQATNEELETTNEELQSSNEELTTVNEELNAKSEELRNVSLVLENIQNSIGAPLVILDLNLRLLDFNDETTKLFYITDADIGRDFTKISSRMEIPDFLKLAKTTIETGKMHETVCSSKNASYNLQFQPSYDENKKMIGVILVFMDATERIRTQQRLVQSEERTRAIIDATPSLVSMKDNLGRYQLVNSAFKEFFKVDDSIIGKTDREALNEKTALQLRDVDLEVFLTRQAVRREERIISGSGKEHVLLSTRFPVMDPSSRAPIAVGTIALDITAQVEAQKALQKSESLYRAIVEDQTVFVCRFKPDGEFVFINETFARYFGQSMESLKNKKFIDLVDPVDRPFVDQRLKAISSFHQIDQLEHRVSRWHSEKRWVRWIHRGLFDSSGKLIEFQSVGFDVTDYRMQTDNLLQKEAIFAGIFDNTSDYISIFKVNQNSLVLESMNRSAEKLLGRPLSEIRGMKAEDIFSKLNYTSVLDKYWNAVNSKAPKVHDEKGNVGGQERAFLTTLVPIPNSHGEIERLAAIRRDISTYKKIESDLRNAKEAAEIANRAKSDFLASMSHELRTPLNVVLGFCQMLELSSLDKDQTSYVNGIHRSGELLLNLIEDVLDISKIEAGKVRLETINFIMEEFIKGVSELFEVKAKEKGLSIVTEISPLAAKTVIGDPNRLRQILVNFLGNALKFTSKGQITIKVDAEHTHENGVLNFVFSVVDTGIGIRAEDKNKMFQKFSQAETGHARRFGGTGLGLAISKQLISLMNGEVGVESEFGKGSTFWFKVPLATTDQAPEVRVFNNLSKHFQEEDGRKMKVLVVDDNQDSRTIAELFLKRLGHVCKSVDSGITALKVLKEEKFDLVLMDMQMPELDGCGTTSLIRRDLSKNLPVVALTANAMAEDVERCYQSGMNDYLSKPIRMEELSNLLGKWSKKNVVIDKRQ